MSRTFSLIASGAWRRTGSGTLATGVRGGCRLRSDFSLPSASGAGFEAAAGARSGRCSYTKRITCARVGIVAQLAILVARDVVDFADGGKHLCLLDGVDAEIGFEIEIQIQHIFGIAGLLYRQSQDALFDRVFRLDGRCGATATAATGADVTAFAGSGTVVAGAVGVTAATTGGVAARSGRFS